MEEKQEKQDIQKHNQIKKQFIREQLKPQRHKMAVSLVQKGILVLCAAVLFGGIAALSFYIMRVSFPWDELGENVTVVSHRTATSEPQQERTVSDEINPDVLYSLENFNTISAQFAEIGSQANAAVVSLDFYDMSMSRDHRDAVKFCGILFHESEKFYYILTEYALAQLADKSSVPVTAEFYAVKSAVAKVSGSSEKLDLAVFSVDKSQFTQEEQKKIVIAELGDDSSLKMGSAALIVGKPNGRFYSVSTGLITNNALTVLLQDMELRLYTMDLAYQDSRAGFVLNIQGNLVGMLTVKHTLETGEIDTAFVGLSDLATDLNHMIQGEKFPDLGIYGFSINSGNNSATKDSGIYINQVESRSPAYQGKLRVADVITEVDGHAIKTMKELHEYLAECKSGQEITIMVERQGNSRSIQKKLKIILK